MMKKYLMAGTASALLALTALPNLAEAKTRMLLIGVADYNEDSGIRDLLGPRNDVSIMWRLFKSRGVDPKDITVLSDGIPEGAEYPAMNGPATIENIRAAFDKIAAETGPEDDFIFYYSGHGTRQPDNDKFIRDFFLGGGSRYSGLWTGDAGKLVELPLEGVAIFSDLPELAGH